jgi:trans-aconitate 2-methyltransferase
MAEPAGFTTRSDAAAQLVDIWRRFRSASGSARVLDLGCGTGGAALEVARGADGSTALGLDISQSNIDRAAQDSEMAGLSDRVSFVCSPYEAWQGGTFDAILSDGVLHLMEIRNDALAHHLAANLVPGGLLVATMPSPSLGNSLRLGLRRLWRATPAGLDRTLLALAKPLYPPFSTEMLEERLPYMRVLPVRLYDAAFMAALASAGLEHVAELPWPNPSIAKLLHVVLVWRRRT